MDQTEFGETQTKKDDTQANQGAKENIGPVAKPAEQKAPKDSTIAPAKVLSDPRLSPKSKSILQKLTGKNPFVVMANDYGKAIAESIIIQSDAVKGFRVNFDESAKTRIEISGNSYGLIYKGNTPLRITPFVWQLDQGTRRKWAVFRFENFYGHKYQPRWKIWQNLFITMVLTPYDDSSKMVDSYGKGALVKFDERTQFQMPMNIEDSKEMENIRNENRNFISAALTLWMDLSDFTKAKLNMKYVLWLVAGAGIVIFLYWFLSSHPGFLTAIIPRGPAPAG